MSLEVKIYIMMKIQDGKMKVKDENIYLKNDIDY